MILQHTGFALSLSTDHRSPYFSEAFKQWQYEYNALRPHSSLRGRTPLEKLQQVKDRIPTKEEVEKTMTLKKRD